MEILKNNKNQGDRISYEIDKTFVRLELVSVVLLSNIHVDRSCL